MDKNIPSAAEVQALLKSLTNAQVVHLARLSEVPFATLAKVRSGDTVNPGIETVRKFLPHVTAARLATATASA